MPTSRKTSAAVAAAVPVAGFQAIRSARAFEEIAAQIRAELAAGRLKVGSRLPSERALSEQFGVSRNTLREALRSLEHAGLIRLQKGASGGAFITEGSGEAVVTGLLDLYHVGAIGPAQLTQARIWLESVIVREACHRTTPEFLDELERNVDEAEAAIAAGDFQRRVDRHMEFHRILARMTGNPIMIVVMDAVLVVLRHFIGTIGVQDNPYTIPSRRRFIRHVKEGDVQAAVAEMENSLKRLERSYLSRLPAPAVPPVAGRRASGTRPISAVVKGKAGGRTTADAVERKPGQARKAGGAPSGR